MKKALIIVDVQNDFMPWGTLPVPNADQIIPCINGILPHFECVVATQDWHPESHVSFKQWPIHCVEGTQGAELVSMLDHKRLSLILRKGASPFHDSYSAFADQQGKTTGLGSYLRGVGIKEVHIVGVATDICVLHTVQGALEEGFSVHLFQRGCAGLDNASSALKEMEALGVVLY